MYQAEHKLGWVTKRRVAIACQGGGSHTAFTAGVLARFIREMNEERHNYEVVALSGTSGGSICALLEEKIYKKAKPPAEYEGEVLTCEIQSGS